MLTTVNSSTVRVLFRLYFIVITFCSGFVGNRCSRYVVHIPLVNGYPIKILTMTGWLKGSDIFITMVKLRRFPTGKRLGSVMVICSLLSLLADLFVSCFVRVENVSARCTFGQGIVVPTTQAETFYIPPVNGRPYTVVQNSQLISVANGGLMGIYKKANGELNFQAQRQDVLASWSCTSSGDDLVYEASSSSDSVIQALVGRGTLYSNPSSDSTSYTNGSYTHLVAWSSSVGQTTGTSFDVRVSIDLTAGINDNKVMRSFLCAVDSHAVDTILSQFDSAETLYTWVPGLQGGVYAGSGTAAQDDAAQFIEMYLNSMIMIAGGNNYLLQTPIGDQTQGCIVMKTNIGGEVIVVVIIAAATFVALIAYWVFLFRRWKAATSRHEALPRSLLYIPEDVFGWMRQAARENLLSGRQQVDVNGVQRPLPNDTEDLRTWMLAIPRGVNGGDSARLQVQTPLHMEMNLPNGEHADRQ